MRYLGVDPGGRKLGLAIGDDDTGVVSPLKVLPYGGVEAASETIAGQARSLGADFIVVGWPARADGTATAACKRSDALAAALRDRGLEVSLQSEYLTTNEARRRARDAGLGRHEPVDHLAAQVLLEEYLDRRQA